MSFEDLNQFHSFYFAEVINFKREQSGIVIVVELRDSGEREREREREREILSFLLFGINRNGLTTFILKIAHRHNLGVIKNGGFLKPILTNLI